MALLLNNAAGIESIPALKGLLEVASWQDRCEDFRSIQHSLVAVRVPPSGCPGRTEDCLWQGG